jgi:outer membrane cobalamin receptor
MKSSTRRRVVAVMGALATTVSGQSPGLLPELRVLSDRLAGQDSGRPLAEWNRDDLREAAPRTIDELLAGEPSYSLYRRQTAIFGNPTSAGVSLRNTGATAASRTLVLLDGIPQNDPFGGWVYWARYDASAIDSIRIVPASRAAVWGNQSPAGVIQMNGPDPFEERHVVKLGGGSQQTFSGSTVHQLSNEDQTKAVNFSTFGLKTEGFYAVDPSQRGTIDRKLATEVAGADLKFAWQPSPGLTIQPSISLYTEERENGTPLTENATDAIDLALRVTSESASSGWQALLWHQRREFNSVFSSVSPDRSTETLSLDQFDVPARGTGGAYTWHWETGEHGSFVAGADTRWVRGETHENVGTFRRREAGGEQSFVGIFSAIGYQLDDATRIDASARLDRWGLLNGRRLETSLTTGLPLRTDDQEDRDGLEPSAALEYSRKVTDDLEARVSLGSTFRLPTLNELHRPFRVRSDIVEANPELDAERFVSLETGMQWKASADVDLSIAVFHHWIRDAIANVPVTDPTEISAIFGSIPAGGSGSQRRNVDEAQVRGVEGQVDWRANDSLSFEVAGIWSDTRFVKSAGQPLLEDKPFPQAPDLRVILNAKWQHDVVLFFAGWEYGAHQFDDALASREIPDYTSVRIGAIWHRPGVNYQIRVENLFDEEIGTGLSSDGIRTLAGPRSLWAGVEWEF